MSKRYYRFTLSDSKLGIIIAAKEHDGSYKQEESLKQRRDAAVKSPLRKFRLY